jgi:UPF0755 protein
MSFLLFLIVCGALITVIFYYVVLYNSPLIDLDELTVDKKILITIPKGSSLNDIASILEESGVIENKRTFVWAAKYLGSEKQLKAGKYLLPAQTPNYQILNILYSTTPQNIRITIPEGKRTTAIYDIIHKQLPINRDTFYAVLSDTGLCRVFDISGGSLNGFLMPNTYAFDPGTTEREIVITMAKEFVRFYDDDLQERTRHLKMSKKEIVTLASIIEGETADDDERYLVSAVYHNRLKEKMLLQADPTIQFVIQETPRRLYYKDLEIDNPYNTYKYKGLPPGPINNPGKASIIAALYPANVKYLYMVADGKGKHIFTQTLYAHLKAKKKLDRLRKSLGSKNK